MQPINIYNSQDVKVTIDENGTPVDVYVNGGLATSVLFYANYASLPAQGEGGILYVTEDTNYLYRWDGSYIQVGGGSLTWGQITGTLSNQTDLQTALDDKVPYTGATGNINIGVYNIVANDGTSDSEFAPNFVGVENASGYTVIDPTGLYAVDGSGQMKVNPQGLIFPDASVQTTAGISGVDWGDIQGTLSNQTDLQTALDGKVPYTGATGNVDLGEYGLSGGYYQFDTTPTTYTQAVGNVGWNDTEGTIETLLKGGNVTLEIGQKLVARVVNGTGGNVLKSNYQVVKVTGAQGQRLQVNLAQANNDANSADTLGLIAENISNNQSGFIVTSGVITEINTTGSLQSETWADGDPLYLSPTTAGKITNVKPQAPNHTVIVGFVVYSHAIHGKIFVKVDNGYELDELHNVKINTPLNGQVLRYNGTTFVWENSNDSDNLTFNAPLSRSVNAISISQASSSANGYLSSTDWFTFNSKEPALTKGNLTESTSSVLTISGGSSSVIGSGTTIQVKQASSTQSGYLSSTDWSTFNGKESALTFSAPLSRATNTISIPTASSSANGYLSSTDWTTFNNKQNALTNPVTGTGTNNEIAYFNTTGSTIGSLSTATYPSLTELSYVKGVTSAIQTQLNAKQGTLTLTTTGTSGAATLVGSTLNIPQYAEGITGSGTSGQVAYWNGTSSQTGSNNLFWDATNNRLGIGTNTPANTLDISGTQKISSTGAYGLTIIRSGTVGISSQIYNSTGILYYGVDNSTGGFLFTNGLAYASFFGSGSNHALQFGTNSIVRQTIFNNGNVAIGTTTDSGYKLDVNGTARVQGQWNVTGSTTASSAIARGAYYTPTLVAAANNDVLVGLDINPTFTNGAFTGVSNFPIRSIASINKDYLIQIKNTNSGNAATSGFNLVSDSAVGSLFSTSSTYSTYGVLQASSVGFYSSKRFAIAIDSGTDPFVIGLGSAPTEKFRINNNGNIGINQTTDSGYKLDVNGTARVQGDFTAVNTNNTFGNTTTQNILTLQGTQNTYLKISDVQWGTNLQIAKNSTKSFIIESNSNGWLTYGSSSFFVLFDCGRSSVAISTTTSLPTPNNSAVLDLTSTTKGFLPPRMTGAQGEAISSPAAGLMIYTTSAGAGAITSSGWWGYNGTTWVRLN